MSQDHYSLIYTGRKKKTDQKHKPKQINPTLHDMPIKKNLFIDLKKKKKEISHIKFLQNPMHIDSIL